MKIREEEFNLFGVNTYIVWDEATGEAAIIDPGMMDRREEERLSDEIDELGVKPKHLINTHLHIDHSYGNEYVMNTYGLKTEAHKGDAPLGEQIAGQAKMFHLPVATPAPLRIDHELKEGDKIYLGKEALEVIEVPGHSPGSIVLYAPESGFMITGDVLFRGSIGRTDLPGGNGRQLVEGIREKLLNLPPDTIIYPGHGPATTLKAELEGNPYIRMF